MATLVLTPAQRSYLDLLELLRAIAPYLGHEQQFDLTKRLAALGRELFGSARLVLAWKRIERGEEIESQFLNAAGPGMPCLADGED